VTQKVLKNKKLDILDTKNSDKVIKKESLGWFGF
jgi:hypothetical protein